LHCAAPGISSYHPPVAVIFVFVDGVGSGRNDPSVNPLARGEFLLSQHADGSGTFLPRGGRAGRADATLGVAGRPQSATGQATLLTGENAPRALGRHLLGFPNAALRALITERSLFRALAAAGRTAVFTNAYPVAYLHALGLAADGAPEPALRGDGRRRVRAAATTIAYGAAAGRFRTWRDAAAGGALTHDVTGERANRYGAGIPPRTPEAAAGILLGLAAGHDLALFESDEAGHAQAMEPAVAVLTRLDRFLRALVAGLGSSDALLVTSDHGNVEDLSTRNHTLAPVPVLAFGAAAGEVDAVSDLTAVAPLLLRLARVPAAP